MPVPAEWLKFAPKPRPLAGDDQWNVFLSYRSVNRTWVLNLYDVLCEIGHKVFLDQRVIRAGEELSQRLEEALEKSQAGVLIWSSATRDSDWVRREYGVLERQATEKKEFCFVPVRLDGSKLPSFAANRVYLDFSAYPDGPNGGELLRLLYAIAGQSLGADALRFANEQDEEAMAAEARIKAAVKNGRPDGIKQLWEADGLPWLSSAALGCKAAEALTRLGRNDDAIGMLKNLEALFPKAVRPRQLHALALARRAGPGDLDEAQNIVGELYEREERDPETLGIYGRTWMDRYAQSKDLRDLQQSRDLYAEAFKRAPDDYYTGINAAAKTVFLGAEEDLKRAAEYAKQVEAIVGNEPTPGDYWKTATAGEACLIQRKYQDAARLYDAAIAIARTETASHESTWLQAGRLMDKLQPTADERAVIAKPFQHLRK
jgi:tetratricopeptide (TPR) repeat protein